MLQNQQPDLSRRLLLLPDCCHPVLQSLEHPSNLLIEQPSLVVEYNPVAQAVKELNSQLPL